MPESIFHVNDAEDAFPVQFWSNVREGMDDEVFTFDRAVQVAGIKTDTQLSVRLLHDNERVYPVGRFVATDENAVLDHFIEKLLKLGLYGERNATRGVNNRLHS